LLAASFRREAEEEGKVAEDSMVGVMKSDEGRGGAGFFFGERDPERTDAMVGFFL